MPDSTDRPPPPANWLEEIKRAKIWMCAPAEKGKNPLNARTGGVGSPVEPAHWDTYEVARATAERLGLLLGIALGPIQGMEDYSIVAVDFDAASSDGKLRPYVQRAVDLTRHWFYEVSRSLKGLHGYAVTATKIAAAMEARRIKKEGYGLEFYPHGRYFIWTEKAPPGELGLAAEDLPLIEDEAELQALMKVYDEFEAIREDIYLAALIRRQMVLGKGKPKKGVERWNIRCPWFDQHSQESGDTETMYVPEQGGRPPGFDCRHAHCEKKKMPALIEWLKKQDPAFKEALAEQVKARRMKGIAGPEFYEAMIGQRLIKEYGKDFRYVAERRQWLDFPGMCWKAEKTERVIHLLKQIAIQIGPPSKSGNKASTISGAERMARSDPEVAMEADKFDANSTLFNHLGGTFDTTTGKTREHRREDYLTMCASAKPEGGCPVFLGFLDQIMAGDAEMITYLQRVFGYCLTGRNSERAFFNFYGEGANGKTVLLETIGEVFGSYGHNLSITALIMHRHEQHSQALAQLDAKRFIYTTEPGHNQSWDVALLKRLSGESKVRARGMKENDRDIRIHGPIFAGTNHMLRIGQVDAAIKDRLQMVPFGVVIAKSERDLTLKDKLLRERNGILQWMTEGLRDYREIGLKAPDKVLAATTEYFDAEDWFKQWLKEECDVGKDKRDTPTNLFRSAVRWREANGEKTPGFNTTSFGRMLTQEGFLIDDGKRWRQGLAAKPPGGSSDGGSGSAGSGLDPYGGGEPV